MRRSLWKKTLAACFALLIVSGGVPVQPFSQMFERSAITASAAENVTICGDFTVTGGTLNTDYKYENNVLTILTDTPITISGTTSTERIEVASGVSANVTLSGVNITSDNAAFRIANGSTGNVTVTLEGDNYLKSGKSYAGLQKNDYCEGVLTINGTGSLTATGGENGAGIGGGAYARCQNIIINSGTVTATGGKDGAGIGGGNESCQDIIINSGTVTATGGENGAGIGSGGYKHNGAKITINGGTVTATGGRLAAGIGGSQSGFGPGIIISGGKINATGGEGGYGIGAGWHINTTDTSSFSTGTNGHAFIITSSISARNNRSSWSGIILEKDIGNTGVIENHFQVYGNTTLESDVTIPRGTELKIPKGTSLEIASDVILINKGTIKNDGSITNNGDIINDGIIAIAQNGNITNNGTMSGSGIATFENFTVTGGVLGIDFIYETHESFSFTGNGDSYSLLRILTDTPLTIEGNGEQLSNYIFVESDVSANITLRNVNIKTSNFSAFYINGGEDKDKNNITVTLEGENILQGFGEYHSGIEKNPNQQSTLTIKGEGTLTATGGIYGAGIGGSDITIDGGNITATGGMYGAGIGGSYIYYGSNITINGGTIHATGGEGSAGIGGGYAGNGDNIIINDGFVYATGSDGAAGIGKGAACNNEETVRFSTGENGNAYIVANGISDTSNQDSWSGIFFPNGDGKGQVYGSPVLTKDLYITHPDTLTIPENASLEITKDVTLNNTAGATIINCGNIIVNGSIENKGIFINRCGTMSGDGDMTNYESNGGTLITAPTEDMIYVPTGLVYRSGDMSELIKSRTYLYGSTITNTIFKKDDNFTIDITGWELSVNKVNEVLYTVTYANKEIGKSISKNVYITCKHSRTIAIGEEQAPTCTDTGMTAGEKCFICDATIAEQETIAVKPHADENNDGICDNGCGLAMSAYGIVLNEVSATLEGDIGMNYYITLPQSVVNDDGAYVQFTVNGKSTKESIPVPEANGTYKFTCRMNAKEMYDKVTFEVYDGNNNLVDLYSTSGNKSDDSTFEYSLSEYFNTLSSDTSPEKEPLVNLSKATLSYGSYVQKAFGHNVDDSADSGMEISDVTVDTLENHKMTKNGELPEGLKLSEMTLILETETTLCLYFKADDINNYSFTLDDDTVTPVEISGEGLYCIKVANIAAKDLDTQHTLIINGNCTITFDALSYAYSVVKAGKNDSVCDAVKALYKYNEAANIYFQ